MPKEASLSESDLLAHLNRVREEQGEEAYALHVRALARNLAQTEAGKEWVRRHFPDLDLEELAATPVTFPANSQEAMKTLRAFVPGLRTQAQFDAIMLVTEAFYQALDAHCESSAQRQDETKHQLDRAFVALAEASKVTQQLEDVPEAATSEAAEAFKTPPKQFAEQDLQRDLLTALGRIKSAPELNAWYADPDTKDAISRIATQALRNELFDCIRNKRRELSN